MENLKVTIQPSQKKKQGEGSGPVILFNGVTKIVSSENRREFVAVGDIIFHLQGDVAEFQVGIGILRAIFLLVLFGVVSFVLFIVLVLLFLIGLLLLLIPFLVLGSHFLIGNLLFLVQSLPLLGNLLGDVAEFQVGIGIPHLRPRFFGIAEVGSLGALNFSRRGGFLLSVSLAALLELLLWKNIAYKRQCYFILSYIAEGCKKFMISLI